MPPVQETTGSDTDDTVIVNNARVHRDAFRFDFKTIDQAMFLYSDNRLLNKKLALNLTYRWWGVQATA
ncbi:Hypothetical protein PHPALM_15041 [Phytophthora palmivora]|uniref:Uncharacterized protein n=1 Tax=Phytophthora palmivora TaxID=4796 RepID=A0A2P4XT72_9STRA|nr:Hypothetical protein PHPALM_15041 [Phytophthora palmivora]